MNILMDKFLRIALKILSRLEVRQLDAKPLSDGSRPLPKIIYVTSAIAGEGKSFVSQAISKSLVSCSVNRVLLIDANMDAPSSLSKGKIKGLSNYFSSPDEDILRLVVKLEKLGFDFLPSGSVCKPGLLYQHDRVESLLRDLSVHYDLLVIDGASLLKSGANSLAHSADGVVLVIKGDKTSKDLIKEGMAEFNIDKGKYLGAIINQRPKYIPNFFYKKLV
jgi:Mrp family chromosome partitioning ATPase